MHDNREISSVTSSHHTDTIPFNRSSNHNVAIHYIGGFVIRESDDRLSSLNNDANQLECQKIDRSERSFDQGRQLCSSISNENKASILNGSIQVR